MGTFSTMAFIKGRMRNIVGEGIVFPANDKNCETDEMVAKLGEYRKGRDLFLKTGSLMADAVLHKLPEGSKIETIKLVVTTE